MKRSRGSMLGKLTVGRAGEAQCSIVVVPACGRLVVDSTTCANLGCLVSPASVL